MLAAKIDNQASARLEQVSRALARPEMLLLAGRGLVNRLRGHFQELQTSRPNRRGWPRQNFWSKVRRSVQAPASIQNGVEISINHVGIAQRFYGGTIRPVNKQYLTIPASEEAYGKRAGELDGLKAGYVRETPDSRPRLGLYRGPILGGVPQGGVLFWLLRSVTQQPDPSVLPTIEQMRTAALAPVESYVNRQIQRRNEKPV